jgi:hypothetical protein
MVEEQGQDTAEGDLFRQDRAERDVDEEAP